MRKISRYADKQMILKTFLLLGYFCLMVSLSVLFVTPIPQGYELTVYSDLPFLFWVFTLGTSFLGAGVMLAFALFEDTSKTYRLWPNMGIALINLNNILLLSLPIFLRFASSNRADALNHIGYVRDINLTGRLSQLDFYPAMHILQYALSSISGLSTTVSFVSINLIFILIWSLSTIVLTYYISKEIKAAYIAAAFTACLPLVYYHTVILPSVQSAYLIPLFLSLHFLREFKNTRLLVGIIVSEIFISFLIIFYHPATTYYIIAILVIFEVAKYLYRFIVKCQKIPYKVTKASAINIIAILFITSLSWSLSFTLFRQSLGSTLKWVFGEYDRQSAIGEAVGLVQIASLPIGNFTSIVLNSFGVPILLTGVIILLILVFAIFNFKKRSLVPIDHFIMSLVFIGSIFISIGMFFISSSERYPIRLIRVVVILSISILAWFFYDALYIKGNRQFWPAIFIRHRRLLKVFLTLFLFSLIIISQFNLYESPRNGLPNGRVTLSEMAGMKWFIEYRVPDYGTSSILPNYVSRFDSYYLGMEGKQKVGPNWWKGDIWLPSGFYSPSWSCINQILPGQPAYLLLSDNGIISALRFPEAVREKAHIYTKEDWLRLEQDKSVNKLYDNGAFQIWLTNPSIDSCN